MPNDAKKLHKICVYRSCNKTKVHAKELAGTFPTWNMWPTVQAKYC